MVRKQLQAHPPARFCRLEYGVHNMNIGQSFAAGH